MEYNKSLKIKSSTSYFSRLLSNINLLTFLFIIALIALNIVCGSIHDNLLQGVFRAVLLIIRNIMVFKKYAYWIIAISGILSFALKRNKRTAFSLAISILVIIFCLF